MIASSFLSRIADKIIDNAGLAPAVIIKLFKLDSYLIAKNCLNSWRPFGCEYLL